jgi:WD40 repeat protein
MSDALLYLKQNDRLLAGATWSDVRLWNPDTNRPVGPHLLHNSVPDCLNFSDNGKVVVGSGAHVPSGTLMPL